MAEVIKINRPFVQEDSVDLGVIKINRPFSQEELGEKEPTTGFFGKVPLSKYKAGERNIVGNIFERPGAAIRSAIQGKGYVAGALNPTNVPKFQEQILETYYKKLPNFPGKTVLGNIPSALGMAADIVTEPANLLTGLAPKIPLGAGRTLGQVISATKPAQALKTLGQTPIQDLKISKALMSEKGGVLPKIFNTPNTDSIIDTAINKAIKPSTGGKTTFAQVQNYSTKAREAVKSIYANKDNLVFDDPTHPFGYTNKLPETLNEFSSAVEQTKMKVFEQYDSLVQQAGRERVKISLNDISKELNLLAKNKVLNDVRPEIASYAKQQALRITKRGNYSPQEAQ